MHLAFNMILLLKENEAWPSLKDTKKESKIDSVLIILIALIIEMVWKSFWQIHYYLMHTGGIQNNFHISKFIIYSQQIQNVIRNIKTRRL